ncbi:MAG: ABC transporter permease [Chitinophagaceae bacterium]|nr:ABC transporter permease [Chitinophagaceae bacterium]
MLYNYIRIAWRNLSKQRFYTALNILGLSLGIAGGLLLFQFIRFHLSFDRYHKKDGQLYRAVTELHLDDGSVIHEQGTPLALTEALQNEMPQVKDQTVLLKVRSLTVGVPDNLTVGAPGGSAGHPRFFSETGNVAFADPRWFSLFDYTWIKSAPAASLIAPGTAVITRRLADKYFGKDDPIGKTIRLNDKYPVTITGLLEDYPDNTDLKIDMFLSRASFNSFYPGVENGMYTSWGWINATTQSFVWLPDAAAKDKAEATMSRLKDQHFDKSVRSAYQFHLQALKDLHFDARFGGTMQKSLLVTLAIVGLFLVLIACFNFINLATAQSARRAREVGTRKVLGGTAAGIFWQFMTETACMVTLAAALSVLWIKLILPVSYRWLQVRLPFDILQDKGLTLFLLLLVTAVTAMAGSYPALVLSRWKPVTALKNKVSDTRSVLFRKVLIVFQHVVVQVLIISTIIITLQTRYMKDADTGFNKTSVLMVPVPNTDKHSQIILDQRLKSLPGISSVSFCYQAPLAEGNLGGSVKYDSRAWEDYMGRTVVGDSNFLHTFQLRLLAGRNLQQSDTVREFLINETLLHKFGFTHPEQVIGHQATAGGLSDLPGTIVGVVKDFNIQPLYAGMEPALITTVQSRYRYAAIKLREDHQTQVRDDIQKAWQRVYPSDVFEYHYLDEQIDTYYHKEDLLNKLINTTAVIAIIISCLGLSGLISFFALQRTKEIGIRKVLGATVPSIVYLLSKDFLIMVAGAMIVAVPAAWWFMHAWLQNFSYRIHINAWVFALAGLLSAAIALCTVSYQAIKAAMTNPAESLRSE